MRQAEFYRLCWHTKRWQQLGRCSMGVCFSFPPNHSPAERAVLGCQLGPACTSQGGGRHSQTQPESIQACNTVPFDSPHSSDFIQAVTDREKERERQKELKYHRVSQKRKKGNKKGSPESSFCEHLITSSIRILSRLQLAGHKWNLCMSHNG